MSCHMPHFDSILSFSALVPSNTSVNTFISVASIEPTYSVAPVPSVCVTNVDHNLFSLSPIS